MTDKNIVTLFPNKGPDKLCPAERLPQTHETLMRWLSHYEGIGRFRKERGILPWSAEEMQTVEALQDVFRALKADGWGCPHDLPHDGGEDWA